MAREGFKDFELWQQSMKPCAGQKGGIVRLLDAGHGRQLQELRFDAAPAGDGIAMANK